MKVGSIHKNSKTRYFAVGGYFSYEEDTIKVKAKYKKENLKLKKDKKLDLDTEIKSYDMTEEEKIKIFNKIQDFNYQNFKKCQKIVFVIVTLICKWGSKVGLKINKVLKTKII